MPQEDSLLFHFGPFVNYNLNIHIADFNKLPGVPNCCPRFRTSFGSGFTLGGFLDLPLRRDLGIDLRLSFSDLGANLTEEENIGNVRLKETTPPFNTYTGNITVEHLIKAKLLAIGFEPSLYFTFFGNLRSYLGFKLAYFLTNQYDQREKIISPNNVVFTDDRIIRNDVYNQEIPEINKFQIFGLLGISFDLPLGRGLMLAPELRYYLPFTKVTSVDWRVASLNIGASLRIPVYREQVETRYDTIYVRDTVSVFDENILYPEVSLIDYKITESTSKKGSIVTITTKYTEHYQKKVPKLEPPTLDLKIFGMKRNKVVIPEPIMEIEEIETTEEFPLLPYVYFKRGNSQLNNTAMKLISSSDRNNFNEKNLKWDVVEIYKDLLNIIGKRLSIYDNSRILIKGCNNNTNEEENNLELSQKRAEAVKDYLVNVWQINPDRIQIEARNLPEIPTNNLLEDGKEENQRVEISSNDKKILQPVRLNEIIRKSNPPIIGLVPKINTKIGLKGWDLIAEQENSRLVSFTGSTAPDTLLWDVESNVIPRLETPIKISLGAEDIMGQKNAINREIQIKQKTIKTKREIIKNDTIFNKFSLILFDFDKFELNEAQVDIIKSIKQDYIKPNSIVRIKGYADRIGTSEYNKELSRKRCEQVAKALNHNPNLVIIEPYGSDILIYNNNLPFGRSYSRTVQISIETPVLSK
ncbi:MAG: OmpA family protein [Candidatus Kapabacteria bacterium]|nr:OmpA family protein [Candidatus Kapabacteria bacterium]